MAANTVIDLSNWAPPTRARRVPGKGRPVLEKLCPLQNRKVVDLDGNVGPQPASNGIANRSPNDPYGMQIHAEKLLGNPRNRRGTPGGILPYSKCPQGVTGAGAWLEELGIERRSPCDVASDGKSPIDNEHACECIEAVIARRREVAAGKNAENEERVNRIALLEQRAAQANLDAANANAQAARDMSAAAQALAAAAQGNKRSKKEDAE